MKKILKVLEYILFIIIPIVSVFLCRAFRIAQGEKNEEIVIGIMIGIVIDIIYSFILLFVSKKQTYNQAKKIIIILVAIAVLLASWIGVAYSDYSKVAISFDKPKFCVSRNIADDGGSGKYIGLGYSFDINGYLDADGGYQVEKYTYKFFGITIKQDELCDN